MHGVSSVSINAAEGAALREWVKREGGVLNRRDRLRCGVSALF
jgi:hypothetical protein